MPYCQEWAICTPISLSSFSSLTDTPAYFLFTDTPHTPVEPAVIKTKYIPILDVKSIFSPLLCSLQITNVADFSFLIQANRRTPSWNRVWRRVPAQIVTCPYSPDIRHDHLIYSSTLCIFLTQYSNSIPIADSGKTWNLERVTWTLSFLLLWFCSLFKVFPANRRICDITFWRFHFSLSQFAKVPYTFLTIIFCVFW